MPRFRDTLMNALIEVEMLRIRQTMWKPFVEKSHEPQSVQAALLGDILEKNKNTRFGKEHGFESIESYSDFCKAVPVIQYETLRPYIQEQEEKKTEALNAEQPVLYSQTSGTTGQPKFIPILPSTLSHHKHSQSLFACVLHQGVPDIYQGGVLVIGSPIQEGVLYGGTPYGSMSGLILQSMPYPVRQKYVVPSQVFEIEDYRLKYLLIAAFALKEREITFMATANPSTLLKMLEIIRNDWSSLVKFMGSGQASHLSDDPEHVAAMKNISFTRDEVRAMELEVTFQDPQAITFGMLWPGLKAVSSWTSGSCGVLLPRLQPLLPDNTPIIELGYLASEFRGSITVDVGTNDAVPAFHDNFYEFVEQEDWDSPNPKYLTLAQVEEGKTYYVLVTTQAGLYRYFINDLVQVGKNFNNTPTLRFLQKGKGVTNLTGEKLVESQVLEALESLIVEGGANQGFFMMLADPEQLQYSLYIEMPPQSELVNQFEEKLSGLNIEFREKRKSGRLNRTRVVFLKNGVEDAYKKHCIALGQREGQYKVVHLQNVKDCTFDFKHWEISES